MVTGRGKAFSRMTKGRTTTRLARVFGAMVIVVVPAKLPSNFSAYFHRVITHRACGHLDEELNAQILHCCDVHWSTLSEDDPYARYGSKMRDIVDGAHSDDVVVCIGGTHQVVDDQLAVVKHERTGLVGGKRESPVVSTILWSLMFVVTICKHAGTELAIRKLCSGLCHRARGGLNDRFFFSPPS